MICRECGKRSLKYRCTECMEHDNLMQKKRRKILKENNLCVTCKQPFVGEGIKCISCKIIYNRYVRRKRLERINSNKCVRCGGDILEGRLCPWCIERKNKQLYKKEQQKLHIQNYEKGVIFVTEEQKRKIDDIFVVKNRGV